MLASFLWTDLEACRTVCAADVAEMYIYEGQHADHPIGHVSFASTHGKAPFTAIEVPRLHAKGETVTQMLWPDHCVQGTRVSAVDGPIGGFHSLYPNLGM